MHGSTSPSKNGFLPNSSSHRKPASRRATAESTAGSASVDAGRAQEQQREQSRQPVGGIVPVPRAVRSLAGENLGAEPFARDAGALRGDRRRGGVREVAHRLPADGRVRIEQPVDRVHASILLHLSSSWPRWSARRGNHSLEKRSRSVVIATSGGLRLLRTVSGHSRLTRRNGFCVTLDP